jgi:hypothetical protein
MSLQTIGTWKAGIWRDAVWQGCVWNESICEIVPAPAPASTEVIATGGGVNSDWVKYRDRKRKRIHDDDEEVMQIIEIAMKNIIKEFYDG